MSDLAGWGTFAIVGAPAVLLAILGASSLGGRPLPERAVGVLVKLAFTVSFVSCLVLAARMAAADVPRFSIPLGEWFATPDYHFELGLLVDYLSLTFATLTAALCGLVGAFAHRYLHREPGYHRFFIRLARFALGMMLTVLAGSLEMVYAAWELVGLSSALLIAFYHERRQPLQNGFLTFAIYRVCDLGLLSAVVLVHHFCGTGAFEKLFGVAGPQAGASLSEKQAIVVALLLFVAAIGKSAQLPVSGWLPRAMEGPTPSSAIFYGALSVHAGAFLLLRTAPIFEAAPLVSLLVVVVGLLTAVHAALVEQTQTDIKGALAYASLTQVGIILSEIGLGLRLIPLVHVVGHACSRSLQFLRAPSLLHDLHQVESAVGEHLAHTGMRFERIAPVGERVGLYRLALERAYLDELLDKLIVGPFQRFFQFFDRLERRWMDKLERVLRGGTGTIEGDGSSRLIRNEPACAAGGSPAPEGPMKEPSRGGGAPRH
jgi:NAD(P)H-quinone oxidoreductase subunit 5